MNIVYNCMSLTFLDPSPLSFPPLSLPPFPSPLSAAPHLLSNLLFPKRSDGEFLVSRSASPDLPTKPKKGDVVMFSFQAYGATSGLPSNPKIEKIRTDVTWNDVLQNSVQPLMVQPTGTLEEKRVEES